MCLNSTNPWPMMLANRNAWLCVASGWWRWAMMMMMRKVRQDGVRVWDFPCEQPSLQLLIAFLCFSVWGHSWNPSERISVVVILYTFTAFMQREVRWAIILRYTKRFEIYLIFFQIGSGLHVQWTRCAYVTRCTRGSNSAQIAWPGCSVHFHGSRKWNGLGKTPCGEEDKEFWKCSL